METLEITLARSVKKIEWDDCGITVLLEDGIVLRISDWNLGLVTPLVCFEPVVDISVTHGILRYLTRLGGVDLADGHRESVSPDPRPIEFGLGAYSNGVAYIDATGKFQMSPEPIVHGGGTDLAIDVGGSLRSREIDWQSFGGPKYIGLDDFGGTGGRVLATLITSCRAVRFYDSEYVDVLILAKYERYTGYIEWASDRYLLVSPNFPL